MAGLTVEVCMNCAPSYLGYNRLLAGGAVFLMTNQEQTGRPVNLGHGAVLNAAGSR